MSSLTRTIQRNMVRERLTKKKYRKPNKCLSTAWHAIMEGRLKFNKI